jgi:AcrR family transcriptional regulator
MARPQLHSREGILDAARTLVLDGGARAATLNAIADAGGVPKGSIYHRFASLDELLADMWTRAVRRSQAAFIAALDEPEPMAAAIAGALSIHDFARSEPSDARLLAALRREDLVETVGSQRVRHELAELNRPLQTALAGLAHRLFGNQTREAVELTICAVVDLPIGATRRHLIAGSSIPDTLRPQLEAAVRAALVAVGASDGDREG